MLDGCMICVSLFLMRHSALALFALKSVMTELGISLWKTLLFLDFQMLHMSTAILSILTSGLDCLILSSHCYIFNWEIFDNLAVTQ